MAGIENNTTRKRKRTETTVDEAPISYKGNDGTVWNVVITQDNSAGRLGKHNIMKERPGPTSFAKKSIINNSPASAFFLFIDRTIVDIIINCTQIEAQNKSGNQNWKTSCSEIHQLLAVMLARGVLARGQPVRHVWSNKWGPPIIKKIMARDRYLELIRYIRFDVRTTRTERLQTEKFCLASSIWNRFIENCKAYYIPDENITIDEQLFPTKARCPFTQYIASKPDKFGIKFWLAVDTKSTYLLNGFPYLGKDVHRPDGTPLSEHVVMKLLDPYLGKGRNVTTDNFFTSLKLAEKLEAKKTSIVGTMNRIRREIPPAIKTMKAPLHSTMVLRTKNTTLTVYQAKTSKNVILLSNLHKSVSCSDNRKKIPETVNFYNQTKFGVDVLDQKARLYSCKVSSRRWPLQVFYNVLDFAVINSVIVYNEILGTKVSRREFLLKLIEELHTASTEADVAEDLFDCNDKEMEELGHSVSTKRQNCAVKCTKTARNKTNKVCNKCRRPVCGKCIATKKELITCKLCGI